MARTKYTPFGLKIEAVNERHSLGKNNIKKQANLKTNWQIISSNLFTFFNMILFLLAILLLLIQSYRNMWFMIIAIIKSCVFMKNKIIKPKIAVIKSIPTFIIILAKKLENKIGIVSYILIYILLLTIPINDVLFEKK